MSIRKKNSHGNKPLIAGAHMSIKGGFYQAIESGCAIGCTAMQIFSKSNRQWYAKTISEEEITLFKESLQTHAINPDHVIIHASYLINIASGNATIAHRSIKALEQEIQRCHNLSLTYLVLHPGSATECTHQQGLDNLVDRLNQILQNDTTKVTILLENMAGQGATLGSTFEELHWIIQSLAPKIRHRIGICIDTCHLFAAGYIFNTPAEYKKMWTLFDSLIGLAKIKAFHINDSKTPCGSHVDRHEHIGKGTIGTEAFKLLLHDKTFESVPKILETPQTSLDDHAKNLAMLQKLYKQGI